MGRDRTDRPQDSQIVAPADYEPFMAMADAKSRANNHCEVCRDGTGDVVDLVEPNDFRIENHTTICDECYNRHDNWPDIVVERREQMRREERGRWERMFHVLTPGVREWLSDPSARSLWVRRFGLLVVATVVVAMFEFGVTVGLWAGGLLAAVTLAYHAIERARNDPSGWIHDESNLTWFRGRRIDPWVHVAAGTMIALASAYVLTETTRVPGDPMGAPITTVAWAVGSVWAAYYLSPAIKTDAWWFAIGQVFDQRAIWTAICWPLTVVALLVVLVGIGDLPTGAQAAALFVAAYAPPATGLAYVGVRWSKDGRLRRRIHALMDRIDGVRPLF